MPTYQCCGCSNILHSQGPISALISQQNETFDLDLKIDNDGFIANNSIDEIKRITTDFHFESEVTIASAKTLKGETGDFKLGLTKITGNLSSSSKLPVKQFITLCCSVCNSCCEYER